MTKLINRAEVLDRVGLSYPTVWQMMRRNQFPRSLKLGEGQFSRVAWVEEEVESWIQSRPRQELKGDTETPKRKDAARAAKPKRRPKKHEQTNYSPPVGDS